MNEPAVLFATVLRPHRSISPRAVNAVVAVVGALWGAWSLFFIALGAWPVFPLLGLEVVLLYVALRINLRGARAFEAIRLTADALTVETVDPWGARRRFSFQPHWLQVSADDAEGGGRGVRLRSHGRSLTIAAFLLPEERRRLAAALKAALRGLAAPQPSPSTSAMV